MSNHERLLPRPNQVENISPTPEKCRLDYYQKRPLSYSEIKGKVSALYYREESKSVYQQEMLEISTKRKFGKNAKYPDEKYCDVIKKDKKFIAGLLQADFIKPESLRDYCVLSIHETYFK
jgi:hypothetical protein